MRVSELRFGNWIQDGNEFEQITIDHLNCLNSGRCEYDPIPLTEEWLVKFGLNRHHSDYANNVMFIKNEADNLLTEFEWGVYPNYVGRGIQINNRKPLKYVHQIQNIYFALIGEELNIKQ
jgi:hypothetical protein